MFTKQIFLLTHLFFKKLFSCAAFAFNLSRRGTIPKIKMFLVNLQDAANSIFNAATANFLPNLNYTSVLPQVPPTLPQCRTINSGSFDIAGCMYDFMSSLVALLNCFVTTLLFAFDNSQPCISFTIESPEITVTGSFFLAQFPINRLICLSFSDQMFLILIATIMTLWRVNLHCYFDCPH